MVSYNESPCLPNMVLIAFTCTMLVFCSKTQGNRHHHIQQDHFCLLWNSFSTKPKFQVINFCAIRFLRLTKLFETRICHKVEGDSETHRSQSIVSVRLMEKTSYSDCWLAAWRGKKTFPIKSWNLLRLIQVCETVLELQVALKALEYVHLLLSLWCCCYCHRVAV